MTKVGRKYLCHWCKQEITFDNKFRTKNDKAIPLNPDKTPHDCSESPYNKRKGSEVA